MATKPTHDFGKRRPVSVPTVPPHPPVPVKRSGHVALLLMGTLAVGGGAYALMPRETCQPTPPGVTQPGPQQAGAGCQPRGSSSGGNHSSGGWSSRSSFFSSDSSSSHSASGSSDAGSGSVQRGGFGSFAHAFAGHFSGG